MSISSPSPICLVNGTTTSNGVDVSANSTVTISLQDTAGVKQWNLSCLTTDDLNSAAAINTNLSINLATKTATFTAPDGDGYGSSFIFQSKVNNGIDPNGIVQPTYTTTFKISVLTSSGLRLFAFDESIENNASFGWLPILNGIVRDFGTLTVPIAGAGLFFSGGAYNVGQNSDNSIVVNADNIQLRSSYQTLLNNATASATANTLALRGASAQCAFGTITCSSVVDSGSMTVGTTLGVTGATTLSSTLTLNGNVIFDKADNAFTITSPDVIGSNVSDSFTINTGATVNAISGAIQLRTGNSTGSTGVVGSGAISLATGNGTSSSNNSGSISLTTGNNAFQTGSVFIVTGDTATGISGNILLSTGAAAGTANGVIQLSSPTGICLGKPLFGDFLTNFGGGSKVIFIPNATTIPTTAITGGGGVLYVQAGALKWRGSAGTVTQLGAS